MAQQEGICLFRVAAAIPLAGGLFWGGESEDHSVPACAWRPLELDEWAQPLSGRGWGSGAQRHFAKLTRWQALECLDRALRQSQGRNQGLQAPTRATAEEA